MDPKNLTYLQENLKYLGFGETLNPQLERELKKGEPNFQLKLETEINDKAFAAVLNFRKSAETDWYFFNSYHPTLQRKDGEITDRAFYVNKGKGVTAKEAYNLLDGRSVFKQFTKKDGTTFQAWIQLDFEKKDKNNNPAMTQFHDNYGYNLKEAIGKYAIKEIAFPDQEDKLLKSLQKGNLQSVIIEKDGTATKLFLEANPQYKSVTLYDNGLKRIPKESLSAFQSISADTNVKEIKKEVHQDQKQGPKKHGKTVKEKPEKGQPLLPKKREGTKKGLGLA